eukprot:13046277-Ditylum_brightwellii.AAC.1
MKERGESYVEDASKMRTPVEVQWVLKLGSTTFNVRAALLALLKSMVTVDDTIYLETGKTKEVVRDPVDLPTAKGFTEAFKVTQKKERNKPTRISIYFTLLLKSRLNTIKFDSHVWSYLQKTNVYIKKDNSQRNVVVSPRSIINVHPTLVRKEELENEIRAHMMEHPAPETEDTTQWLNEHHPEYRTDQKRQYQDSNWSRQA